MFNIIAFLGPSGSGKSTIQKELGVTPVVTWTSRPPREGEIHGKDYFFTTDKEILSMYSKGQLLEYTNYNGNLYGMGTDYLNNLISSDSQGSVVVDANGAKILKQKYPEDVLVVGVLASLEECSERLRKRDEKNCAKRLANYEEEVNSLLSLSDIIIVNTQNNWEKTRVVVDRLRR